MASKVTAASQKPKTLLAKGSPKASAKPTLPKSAVAKAPAKALMHKAKSNSKAAAGNSQPAKSSPSAALVAPATPTLQKPEEGAAQAPMTTKNFRNHPDMENFFRFIYENDLRLEALEIIDQIISERKNRRGSKKPGIAGNA
jgi:hypothetical protein